MGGEVASPRGPHSLYLFLCFSWGDRVADESSVRIGTVPAMAEPPCSCSSLSLQSVRGLWTAASEYDDDDEMTVMNHKQPAYGFILCWIDLARSRLRFSSPLVLYSLAP